DREFVVHRPLPQIVYRRQNTDMLDVRAGASRVGGAVAATSIGGARGLRARADSRAGRAGVWAGRRYAAGGSRVVPPGCPGTVTVPRRLGARRRRCARWRWRVTRACSAARRVVRPLGGREPGPIGRPAGGGAPPPEAGNPGRTRPPRGGGRRGGRGGRRRRGAR